jgi:tetratricopeptide (TPR) repeat protein
LESETFKYRAFISYSHNDKKFAKWLHKKIENYKIPNSLRDKYPHLPKDLKRTVFIDEEELPIAASLPRNLSEALESSELLIVVCSPSAASSHWVGKEAEYFKHYHGEDRVLAVLKEGEPNATYSSIYDDSLEAFPKALRYSVDQHGELTYERTEPLAADARTHKEKKKALLKLIAGILKVDFADLWEREKREARKRAIIASMVVVTFLALGIYASTQFLGEQQNKELEHIKDRIALIEYSIRNDDLSQEKVIALNVELKKLKKDKENKEATLEILGKLKTPIDKKAADIYNKSGAQAYLDAMNSKEVLADEEAADKHLSLRDIGRAKASVELYRFEEADKYYQKAINRYFDYENGMEYTTFLIGNNHFQGAIAVLEKINKLKLTDGQRIDVLKRLGYLYTSTNRFKEAEKLFLIAQESARTLTKVDSNDINNDMLSSLLHVFSVLYAKTNRSNEAEELYKESLKLRRSLAQKNPEVYIPDFVRTLTDLALLYFTTDRKNEAEELYKESLNLRRSLAQKNPEAYNPDLAWSLNSLALLYFTTDRENEAEELYKESLKLRRSLAQKNPEAYNSDLARTLNNLADLYAKTDRENEAEELYKESLKLRRSLTKKNPEAYNSDLAWSLNRLADLYKEKNRINEAVELYLEALKILRSLAKNNPEVYTPILELTLYDLADLYAKTDKGNEAEELYKESLIIAKNDPEAYTPVHVVTFCKLADLYKETNRIKEAEELYKESLIIIRSLDKNNPKDFNPVLAFRLIDLAGLYKDTNRINEAVELYLEALKILRSLAKNNPEVYTPILAGTFFKLADLYKDTDRIKEAEELYKESLNIIRSLANANPEAYTPTPALADTFLELADLYKDTDRIMEAKELYKEAEELYKESLKIIRNLAEINPDLYNAHLEIGLNVLATIYDKTKKPDKAEAVRKELEALRTKK